MNEDAFLNKHESQKNIPLNPDNINQNFLNSSNEYDDFESPYISNISAYMRISQNPSLNGGASSDNINTDQSLNLKRAKLLESLLPPPTKYDQNLEK